MKIQTIALIAWITACGAEDSGTSNDIEELDGTWEVVYSGTADPATPDEQLTEPLTDVDVQLTLMNGAGTERVTGMDGTTQCVTEHSVSLKWNDDGTGTITEMANGTVVSGNAAICDQYRNYSLFAAGANALQRVSYNGTRLVLMAGGTAKTYYYYAVLTR